MGELGIDSLVIRELDRSSLDVIAELNREVFGEERIINTFDRQHLMILLAEHGDRPIGFKIGYRENRFVYYSAKGGVIESARRMGVATALMDTMIHRIRPRGYRLFAFDTFPNRHPGMTVLALQAGFRVTQADFNATYRDFRLRFEKRI